MAESNDDSNGEKKYFRNRKNKSSLEDSDSESEDANPRPDIGLGSSSRKMIGRKQVSESSPAGSSSDVPSRREDNPFSFKHFLNRDVSSSSSSQSTGGARPKVFSQPLVQGQGSSSSISTSPAPVPAPRLNPELTSGLPDFVQDHLVIEQCYLQNAAHNSSCQLAVDLDNLPDFAPVNVSSNDQWNSSSNSSGRQGDLPFDLTSNQRERSSESVARPRDLPETLPFDLPAASAAVEASKSLPDFLSDGPIHSGRRNDSSQPNSDNSSPPAPLPNELPSPRLQMENERLRRELDNARRQLNEQIRRNDALERELMTLRSKEHEAGLEGMIAQIEENLKRTRRRATNAEDKAEMLEKEVKVLRLEILKLRSSSGSEEAGACGSSSSPTSDRPHNARLSRELRSAASSAEILLRQLLSGVDNLRFLASTLENSHNVDDRPPDFSDTMDEPGPTL
ncbi:hypothetical protein LSTR_LSTR005090 [Laodelphax striatellus]|uniref:Endosome-associated-trafficking regulator 1 n=1 Tax=Laodelphax striatellus TaxID=195883 RepID=A0A482WT72_LAOST|nr:hypothetical protein LSTR_LSTR005090 [Laodelphax striatellus]